MSKLITIITGLLLLTNAWAENSTQTGAYTIHHNVVTTDALTPTIASNYNIQRSKSRALVNISVHKNNPQGLSQPVTAQIDLTANSQLLRRPRNDIPTLRKAGAGNAIYYITDFPVGDREHLLFEVEVLPEGEVYPLRAKFEQQFYTR